MRFRKRWSAAIVALLGLLLLIPAVASSQVTATHQITDANGDRFEVAAPFTVDTIPDVTVTTTTAPPVTTTTAPPEIGPDPVDVCEEPPADRGNPCRFDILVTAPDLGLKLWEAPYLRYLSSGAGWIDGDRAGYRCAYMFLEQDDEIVGRVTFVRGPGAGYVRTNDRYMAEIQQTGRAFDGGLDGVDQAECPLVTGEYEQYFGEDVRPQIRYVRDGVVLENRSYDNTGLIDLDRDGVFDTMSSGLLTGRLRFSEVERITVPFHSDEDPSLLPGYPCDDLCTVYERVTVAANVEVVPGSGEFFPGELVYYDSLSPEVSLIGGEPVPFEGL